jgi:hypothetical protein
LDLEALPNEDKRRRKIVPYRVAEEIQALKLILFSNVPDKGGAWFFKLRDLPAVVTRLYADAAS